MAELNEPAYRSDEFHIVRSRLAAVDALHGALTVVIDGPRAEMIGGPMTICAECRQPWPCRTARAIR